MWSYKHFINEVVDYKINDWIREGFQTNKATKMWTSNLLVFWGGGDFTKQKGGSRFWYFFLLYSLSQTLYFHWLIWVTKLYIWHLPNNLSDCLANPRHWTYLSSFCQSKKKSQKLLLEVYFSNRGGVVKWTTGSLVCT